MCGTGQTIKPFCTNIAPVVNGKKKRPHKPHSMNVLDYPCTMSGFERESLAAEAKLKADKKRATRTSQRLKTLGESAITKPLAIVPRSD
jgi:hypothetical protein